MTVSSTTNRWDSTGNGVTTVFAYTNRIFATSDLKVYLDGTLKTLTTHYTVSGAGETGGGNVTFLSAPASSVAVAIVRDVPSTQGLDLAALGSFPAEENEKALDRLTILIQQLEAGAERTLRQPTGDAIDIAALPVKTARAGRALGFDSNGDPAVSTNSLSSIDDILTSATAQATAAASSATSASSSATAAASSASAAASSASSASSSATAAALSASSVTLPTAVADTMLVRNAGNTAYETKTAAQTRAFLDLEVGSDVQAYDAATLKGNAAATLGDIGFATTPHSYGTVTSGTTTVDLTKSIQATLTANGAFTLAPDATHTGYQEILVTNGASAGSITTSGWDKVIGTYATTNANKYNFICKQNTGYDVLIIEDLN